LKEGGIDFVFLLFSLLLPSYFVPPLFIHGRRASEGLQWAASVPPPPPHATSAFVIAVPLICFP
jgi:hypothetical protein